MTVSCTVSTPPYTAVYGRFLATGHVVLITDPTRRLSEIGEQDIAALAAPSFSSRWAR
ncbi:hypothetical protein [Streptomyces sp. NPDC001743]|uniref:hypothetical protein n=1 Tax=Streptomyces sp. NPDC001743 TaxID=3154397 RepID=UPI00332C79D7